jgi:hypothetical protein
MWKWLLPISLLFLLGLASGAGFSSSGTGMSSGSGMPSSGTGSAASVGLPSGTGYTPCQKDAIESLRIGFHMGQMSALANQGQNISGFNAEVDRYNAWVQQNFGNDPNLMIAKMQETGDVMPKMQETGDGMPKIQGTESVMPGYFPVPRRTSVKPIHVIDASFNQTTPTFPPGVVQNGRIFDMPAGAWYTTYGPYLSYDHEKDYYGAMGSV